MSVIYAENDCNLSDVGAFYRVEAYNIGTFSTTDQALSTTRTIALTFANAGNLRGILLVLRTNDAGNDRSVQVVFQEYVGSTWTTRDTITLTSAQIIASTNKKTEGVFVPFRLTTPYAVDTTASKWRIQVSHTGGSTGTWYTRTSDATNPFYVAYCDNALSFSANDCLIAEGRITIDQDMALRGVLGTGDTVRSICGIAVRTLTPTPSGVARFYVPEPASLLTITLDGLLVIGAGSGFQVGTSASTITAGSVLVDIVEKATPTSGSAGNSGFYDSEGSANTSSSAACRKGTLLLYGAIPTLERTTLSADAASGQGVINTVDDCEAAGWAIGDEVYVGKQDTTGSMSTTTHTIQSISGTQITLTPVLATANRLSGGSVIRMNGYGIKVRSDSTTIINNYLRNPSNFHIQGVQFYNIRFYQAQTAGYTALDDSTYRSKHIVKNCSAYFSTAASLMQMISAPEDAIDVDAVNVFRGCSVGTMYVPTTTANGAGGLFSWKNCWTLNLNASSFVSNAAKPNISITDNKFENGLTSVSLNGIDLIFTGNYFWGNSSSTGAVQIQTVVGGTIGNNTYNKSTLAIYFGAFPTVKPIFDTDIFGDEQANTVDIDFAPSALLDTIILNPVGISTISETYLPETVEGSLMKLIDETAGTVDGYWTYGKYVKCGYGLADTLVWNGSAWSAAAAGQFSIRFRPLDSVNELKYQDNYPATTIIGNCQNKTVVVQARIKINNANFYAGTHTKPTLRVIYDGGTEATTVATDTTDGQQIQVSFTPTTETEDITIRLEMATDATGTDAYVYLGELLVMKPEGILVDTTGLSKWSNGYPLGTLRTFPSPSSVWDELSSAHLSAGSLGEKVSKKLLTTNKFIGLK